MRDNVREREREREREAPMQTQTHTPYQNEKERLWVCVVGWAWLKREGWKTAGQQLLWW